VHLFRVSPPGEFCTSRFTIDPEMHVFPSAAVGKVANLRATVQLLPRVPEIPRPFCHERHGTEASSESTASKCGRQRSPELPEERGRSASPRFTKPNVLSHMRLTECHDVSGASRWSGQERSVGLMQTSKSVVSHQLSAATITGEPFDDTGDTVTSTVISRYPGATSKDLGAIPKRFFELPLHSAVPSSAEVCCEATVYDPVASVADRIAQCKVVTAAAALPPQVLALQKSSPKAVCGTSRRHSMPPKDGTDSDSSSPDIDAFLSTTLANSRLEPLSPQEMDVYLTSMYPQRMHKFKSVKLKSPEVSDRSSRYPRANPPVSSSETTGPCSDNSLSDALRGIGYRTPPGHRHLSSGGNESVRNGVSSEVKKSDKELTCAVDECLSAADDDSVFEDSSSVDFMPSDLITKCGHPGNAKRQLVYSKHDAGQPKFLVGDEQEEGPKTLTKSVTVADEVSKQSTGVLHKSVSCPNKKALSANGASFHKGNSLLRTMMMKKELQATATTEVLALCMSSKYSREAW